MTVRELIEALAQHDPEMIMVIYQHRHDAYEAVDILETASFYRRHKWFDRTAPGEPSDLDCLALDSEP